MYDDDARQCHIRLLQASGMAEAASEPLNVAELARELESSEEAVRADLGQLSAQGLLLDGLEDEEPPILLTAGRQFLARAGDVDRDVLGFLPHIIGDLHAREALLAAGSLLVDEFRAALLAGDAVDYARELVPPAFVSVVDDRLAIDLFAAAVALMARLSDGAPAGCVAEEIAAVELMDQARFWLESQREDGRITEAEESDAGDELRGLFELFEDDDVLNLFRMAEPADAAVAGHEEINRELGVVDQRVESWFAPFGGLRRPVTFTTARTDAGRRHAQQRVDSYLAIGRSVLHASRAAGAHWLVRRTR